MAVASGCFGLSRSASCFLRPNRAESSFLSIETPFPGMAGERD
jgi:hypothetical protein